MKANQEKIAQRQAAKEAKEREQGSHSGWVTRLIEEARDKAADRALLMNLLDQPTDEEE